LGGRRRRKERTKERAAQEVAQKGLSVIRLQERRGCFASNKCPTQIRLERRSIHASQESDGTRGKDYAPNVYPSPPSTSKHANNEKKRPFSAFSSEEVFHQSLPEYNSGSGFPIVFLASKRPRKKF